MRLLLTGATGFLGGAIAAELARRGLLGRTVFAVRADSPAHGLDRLRDALGRFALPPDLLDQIQIDAILPLNLGDRDAIERLDVPGDLSRVIHCAALATFSNNPAIWASNVEGTLALARTVLRRNRLARWLQVGTAMSCGAGRTPPVAESWEDGADGDDTHLVPYTRSKLAAELALRDLPGLPLVVARPSIVVGHTTLGTLPSPSIFWVFRMAFALERFTCAPNDQIDVIPVDWCARALVSLALKDSLAYDLYHVSAGSAASNRFTDIDQAYASACGSDPIASRYQKVDVADLRSLVPLIERTLGRVNRLLILRALALYGGFAGLSYVFDNRRLLGEDIDPPPAFVDYISTCVKSSRDIPIAEQMAVDFK
jgi:nucleoside-diphosphate-sugar epimerase